MNFLELGLDAALMRTCETLGYNTPTPIQAKAIPVILSGADLIGSAETGSGKTAAFLLPLIQKMGARPRPGIRVLVLAPTRELVLQIETAYNQLAPKKGPRATGIIGGASMVKQFAALKRGVSVVIATPGRLVDHIERGTIDLSSIDALVLDEADRMLDMGFWPAIRSILEVIPATRQTLLFSATMSPEIEKIARKALTSPVLLEVNKRGRPAATVKQTIYSVAPESKTALLLNLLETEDFDRVLVFTRTRRGAERLSHILGQREHSVNRIHADRSQSQRETALREFRTGTTRVLVATDIAARGIDVDAVSHVINFEVPDAPEDYVHRIGRTGRAGNLGSAITLVAPGEELSMRAVERLTGQLAQRVVLPGYGGIEQMTTKPKAFGSIRQAASAGRRSFRPRRATR